MKTWTKIALGALVGAGGVAYSRAVVARNRALERPPMRDGDGEPYEIETIRFSDGEIVEYVDVRDYLDAAVPHGGRTDDGAGNSDGVDTRTVNARDPIVWIPGADGPKETFLYQIPHFARRHRVVSADLRADIREEHDFDRLVDDVAELLDHLDIERCVLVGQSLGSAIAMRFAVRWPERLSGLVLANPVAKISYEHVGLNRSALIPVAQSTTRYLPTPVSRAVARSLWGPLGVWIFDDSPGNEALIDYALFTGPRTTPPSIGNDRVELLKGLDLTDDLWQVPVPTLVVKGPHDVYCPVSWALEIADSLPVSSYVPIPGTGHCSHISRPGAFNQAVEGWLEELAKEPDGGDG